MLCRWWGQHLSVESVCCRVRETPPSSASATLSSASAVQCLKHSTPPPVVETPLPARSTEKPTQVWPYAPFSKAALLQAAGITLLLMVLTFGAHLSTGIFMPLVFVGACLGRVAGEAFKEHIDARIFPGLYALAGAAALLGAVQRGTISLVIILIEGAWRD